MPEIILTDEQARILAQATGPVTIRDTTGAVLGHVEPHLTPTKIAELKRVAEAEPGYSGEQVQAMFRALEEEWERTGGFDEAHLQAFLDRLEAEEQVSRRGE